MKSVIFCYGTLKKGQCRGKVLSDQKFLGNAKTIPAYSLFNCGTYPALVKQGNTSVEGELYEVDEDCLKRLDRIEGAPFLYKQAKVELETHPELDCKTYIYQQSVKSLTECGCSWDDSLAD